MEADLIRRARDGDDAAYERLVREHQEAVFRLAYLFLGDADDAEDTAQEVFIRAHRSLERFDESRPLRPWLLSITANAARNRRRAFGRYMHALRRLILPEQSVSVEAERALEAQALWQAVRRLSAVDQEVIYLRYFLELSVNEAAEAMNVEPGTVKSRLSRALSRLRDVIERDFPLLSEGRLGKEQPGI
ncbi:MAG: sigma-70 family RNA polymerase sigma factor [Anaerolineae bacterium]|nr:sigma-70 family RNA polymerase sigma factor [Anaerolineae bacterium]